MSTENTNVYAEGAKKKRLFSKKPKEKELIKKTPAFIAVFAVLFIILVLHSASLIYPFVWLFLNSLKTNYEYISNSSLLLPKSWLFKNYLEVFTVFEVRGTNFLMMFFNSIWWSVGNTVVGVFMGCVVSYVVARYDFKAKNIIYGVIMFTMMFPVYGAGAAAYKQLFTLGIYDSPLMIIKSAGGYGGFQFLMLYAFFKGLPKDYMEAAEIDGAGDFLIFIRIMMPLAIGPITALSVVSFVNCWNDYMTPIIALPSFPGLATGLYLYEQAMKNGMNYPMYFTGTIVTVIPVIIIFSCFQSVFLNNMSVGGLKG